MKHTLKLTKYWLWKLGLWSNNCPFCGRELMEHGYFPESRYSCQQGKGGLNDCEFNRRVSAR